MGAVVRELDVDNRFSPKASSYDRFNAGLIASISICGFVVLSLFAVWLFGNDQPQLGFVPPLENEWGEVEADQADGDSEQELDFVTSGANDIELVSLVESVEDSVSKILAQDGRSGIGEFVRGTPGVPDPIPVPEPVPPSRRWKISYEVENIEQYKRQLDFFGIEIGVIASRENDIWRVGTLSSDATVTHSNRSSENDAIWFAHSKPALKRWDRKIVGDSGLVVQEMLFVQFYPASVQSRILKLEAVKLQELGRNLDEVTETKLKISSLGDGFKISVSGFEFH